MDNAFFLHHILLLLQEQMKVTKGDYVCERQLLSHHVLSYLGPSLLLGIWGNVLMPHDQSRTFLFTVK